MYTVYGTVCTGLGLYVHYTMTAYIARWRMIYIPPHIEYKLQRFYNAQNNRMNRLHPLHYIEYNV